MENHAIGSDAARTIVSYHNLDCSKLFYVAKQRRVLLQRCIELDGKSITKEPHTGLRKEHPVKHRRSLEEDDSPSETVTPPPLFLDF